MDTVKLTPVQQNCATLHARLLESIQLRDRLSDALDLCAEQLDLDDADLSTAGRWERLFHALGLSQRRLMRRRLAWLDAQRTVFLVIAAEARAARPDAHQSVDRLTEALERAYDAARATR